MTGRRMITASCSLRSEESTLCGALGLPAGTAHLSCITGPSASGAGFADVDAAVEIRELVFGAAAIDGSVDRLVDLDLIFAAVLPAILDGLLRRGSLNLNI